MGLYRRTMSDDTDRLLRIKSLIDRDMQSVRGRIAPVQPPQPMTDSAFQQRKEQLEAQDLAIREKTNKQRQQRQMRHRQYLLAEEAQRAALKEQKQKQETTRLQKENVERQKMQQKSAHSRAQNLEKALLRGWAKGFCARKRAVKSCILTRESLALLGGLSLPYQLGEFQHFAIGFLFMLAFRPLRCRDGATHLPLHFCLSTFSFCKRVVSCFCFCSFKAAL